MSGQPSAPTHKPHKPPNTTRSKPSHRAVRSIKGIQELFENGEDLLAVDYAGFSQSLALASQEDFAIQVSCDGERNIEATKSVLQEAKTLLNLLAEVRLGAW